MTEVVKSVSHSQQEILRSIARLHCVDGFACDLTYGKGSFWKDGSRPVLCYDLEPIEGQSIFGDSTDIQQPDASLPNIVFDPPFLTYIRAGRTGNGNMALAKQFSGYWRYDELEDHYRKTLTECARVLKHKGILVFKCQDIVHNHRLHCTHANVIGWGEEVGFRLKDLFILAAKSRLPSPNRRGTQKHSRIFHSYFLVMERGK